MSKAFGIKPFPHEASGATAVPLIYTEDPTVFAVIVRQKNGNVMCYRGLLSVDGKKLEGIEAFWLDLEPSYRQAARKAGREHDRDELSMADKFAYGFSQTRVNDTTIKVFISRMQQNPIIARLDGPGAVHGYVELPDVEDPKDKICRLRHVALHDPPGLSLASLTSITNMGLDVHVTTRRREEKIIRLNGKK